MRRIRERRSWVVLLAILVLFAACKGDSPTAPSSGGNDGGGGNVPPSNATIVLTASNPTPLVDSSVTVTATVTQGGNPVPNGTAVEFTASSGLIDGAAAGTIKTTTNGVASVVLSSSAAGKVIVQATVNNVSKTVEVTFNEKPVTPIPPDKTPVISSITPTIGRPAGGEVIRITGKNFASPVRVFFDTGAPTPVEAFVAAVTETTIDVVTPAVNLGAGQQMTSSIIVLTSAGTAAEARVEATDAFTFRNTQLTPVISAVSPNSGPIVGGTRFSIFGEGFQAPVQVLFGSMDVPSWTEVQVVSVTYGEIIAVTPPASATAPGGSGTITGPVDLKVVNIASNTSVEMNNAFRYVEAMQITNVSPGEGPYTGGTRVTIDGHGFVAPVSVSIGGIPAQPVSVSGTRIVAITGVLDIGSCADGGGPVIVTNITNGDTAVGPTFIYRVPAPLIAAITPSFVTAGNNVQVRVNNAQPGVTRITLGDRELFPSGTVFNDDGSALFTVAVPTNYTFPTQACTVGGIAGTQQLPITVDVKYANLETGCANLLTDGLEIRPADTSCVLPPPPNAVIAPPTPPCTNLGAGVAWAGSETYSTTFIVSNIGGQPLNISSAIVSASSNATVTVAPPSGVVAPGGSLTFTVTADPTAGSSTFGGTITVTTNDPDTPNMTFCVTGTTAP